MCPVSRDDVRVYQVFVGERSLHAHARLIFMYVLFWIASRQIEATQ